MKAAYRMMNLTFMVTELAENLEAQFLFTLKQLSTPGEAYSHVQASLVYSTFCDPNTTLNVNLNSCDMYNQAVVTSQSLASAANLTMEAYRTSCNTYKSYVEQQISAEDDLISANDLFRELEKQVDNYDTPANVEKHHDKFLD